MSIVENGFIIIFHYYHSRLTFKLAALRFVNFTEEEINMRKENAVPRNIKHATESWEWHLSMVRCESCVKCNKETFKIAVKKLLNFPNTLAIYFIYVREWFQQETEFTTDFETILASLLAFS